MTVECLWTEKFGDVFGAMFGLDRMLASSGLEQKLLLLVENAGVADQRLRLLHRHAHQGRPARRRDRAADLPAERLARSAALLRARARSAGVGRSGDELEKGEVPDEVYAQAREHFDEQQLMKLTWRSWAINGWNRFCIPSMQSARDVRGRGA